MPAREDTSELKIVLRIILRTRGVVEEEQKKEEGERQGEGDGGGSRRGGEGGEGRWRQQRAVGNPPNSALLNSSILKLGV